MPGYESQPRGGRGEATGRVKAHLREYLEEESPAALDAAVGLCRATSIDVGAVLDWLGAQHADPALKARALREVRRAVGLPLRAGPVCRTPR